MTLSNGVDSGERFSRPRYQFPQLSRGREPIPPTVEVAQMTNRADLSPACPRWPPCSWKGHSQRAGATAAAHRTSSCTEAVAAISGISPDAFPRHRCSANLLSVQREPVSGGTGAQGGRTTRRRCRPSPASLVSVGLCSKLKTSLDFVPGGWSPPPGKRQWEWEEWGSDGKRGSAWEDGRFWRPSVVWPHSNVRALNATELCAHKWLTGPVISCVFYQH